jgi:hypothetical protein
MLLFSDLLHKKSFRITKSFTSYIYNPHGILDQDFFSYENLRPAERRKKLSALVMTFMFLYRLTILQL